MNKHVADAQRIYVDANIIIYFVEGWAGAQENIARLFSHAEEKGMRLITSEITVSECLYGAYKAERSELVERYREIFSEIEAFELVPVEFGICERAAKVGAANGLKLIDAIHVTSALKTACDVFVTNDKGIRSSADLCVVQLADL